MRTVAKTDHGRWVSVPETVFAAVPELCPRDDRHPDPHALRHRRISLWHLGVMPWATIGAHVSQRDRAVTANTYSHGLLHERELDYATLLVT